MYLWRHSGAPEYHFEPFVDPSGRAAGRYAAKIYAAKLRYQSLCCHFSAIVCLLVYTPPLCCLGKRRELVY